MKKSVLFLFPIIISALSVAQCAPGGSGTTCTGTLTVSPQSGNTTQSAIVLSDLGQALPSPASGNYILSISNGVLQESDNGGSYHSLAGAPGPQGPQGQQGPAGAAGTVAVGTTTTLSSGSKATVSNSGTSNAAVLNFGIPQGAAGAQGKAATIAVGSVTTLASGSVATVANSGTANAAVLNFGIPQGSPGVNGQNGRDGNGVPAGGSSGQLLVKRSNGDFDTQWINTPQVMPFDYTLRYATGGYKAPVGLAEVGLAYCRDLIDMSGVSQVRLIIIMGASSLSPGSYAIAQYSTDLGQTWNNLSPQVTASTGEATLSSGWGPLPTGANGDYLVRLAVYNAGSATATIGLQNAHLQFR